MSENYIQSSSTSSFIDKHMNKWSKEIQDAFFHLIYQQQINCILNSFNNNTIMIDDIIVLIIEYYGVTSRPTSRPN